MEKKTVDSFRLSLNKKLFTATGRFKEDLDSFESFHRIAVT